MSSPESETSSTERLVFTLPDNLRDWPWQRRINPFYEEAKIASTGWIRGFKAFSPRAQKAFERCDFDRLASLAYPDTSYNELRVSCDLMQLFFVFDEHSDVASADDTCIMADAIMDGLRNPWTEGPKAHLLGEITRQFWSRVVQVASPGVQKRFIDQFERYVYSVVDQARDRDEARTRDIDEYFDVRRLTIGAYPSFVLLQMGMGVSDEAVFEHPTVVCLETLATDMIILGNNLSSYNVEQARGDTHNVLVVVRNKFDWPLDRALQWLAERHDALAKEFLELKDAAPPEVAKYTEGLGNWVRASDVWGFESQRYFGPTGSDVMRERKVVLLPKERRHPA
ncbi:putative terpene cyclase [Exidia glandulosa HHB12029]|uniref:Terpene synthase n=1 Tax=Exidia glandulosa HHB12029 TaxID=1314781 RepID=A0A165EXH7_EXIGL|nr:putative terpene cyclase [Exidia glandulosa HHB12029]